MSVIPLHLDRPAPWWRRVGEFHDQPGCPAWIRDGLRDFLAGLDLGRTVLVEELSGLLRRHDLHRIIDRCAGTGGVWRGLLPDLRRTVPGAEVVLTDLHPPAAGLVPRLDGLVADPHPCDALGDDRDPPGVRTWIRCFHHFTPAQQRRVLATAVATRQPLLLVETTVLTPRNLLLNLGCLLGQPLAALHRAWRAPLAALGSTALPVLPLVATWDALASVLRTGRPDELLAQAETQARPDWRWSLRIGRSALGADLMVLTGEPC